MSEESKNQLQDLSGSAAMPVLRCPVEPSTFLEALRSTPSTGLRILEEIEKHVATGQCHHPPLKDLILHVHGSLGPMYRLVYRLEYSTPLLLACYVGDLDCVKHIVENWLVDFQAAAEVCYFIDSWKTVALVTPLFVAVQNRHFAIVQYLVRKGADVIGEGTRLLRELLANPKYPKVRKNARAITLFLLESGADPNTTDGYPIWMGQLCGAKTTTALVLHGLKLDQRTYCGDTILHYIVKYKRPSFQNPQKCNRIMALFKFLVDNGADLMARDREQGFTPYFIAAVNGSWPVIDYILEKDDIVRKEKIDALEMAAATILSSNDWESEQERAFEYLRKALLLRQMEPESLHMTLLKLKRGRTVGWTTSAQLDQVIAEPAEYHLQSYLIQLRILCYGTHGATSALRRFLMVCVDFFKEQNRLDDLVDVLWATFEKIQLQLLDSQHEDDFWRISREVVPNLILVLSQFGMDDPLYIADTFRSILKALLVTDRSIFNDDADFPTDMDTLLEIFLFLAGLPEEILNDETQEPSIKELLHHLVFLDSRTARRDRGQSLLHDACEDLDLCAIQLLLQYNADPNSDDYTGNRPLHVLASSRYGSWRLYKYGQELSIHRAADAARLLLNNGAHLDIVNQNRKTAADVWKEENKSQDLPNWLLEPGSVPKLKCLTARIISSNNVPYTTETLIEILHPFVKEH